MFSRRFSTQDVLPLGDEYAVLGQANIGKFFGDETLLLRRFSRLAERECLGIVKHEGAKWISYGWMTTSMSQRVPHFPPWFERRTPYWIFGCGTREEYRSRGHYTALLKILGGQAALATGAGPDGQAPLVALDTWVDNGPGLRAPPKAGFASLAEISLLSLDVRGRVLPLVARWHPADHP